MPLINFENTVDLNWSENCVLVATDVADQGATFSITDKKLFVPVVTLSSLDIVKLIPDSKTTINRNKYQTKVSTERPNQYLDFLIDPSFHGVN